MKKKDLQEISRQLYYIGATERKLLDLVSCVSSIRGTPALDQRSQRINKSIDEIQHQLDLWKWDLLKPYSSCGKTYHHTLENGSAVYWGCTREQGHEGEHGRVEQDKEKLKVQVANEQLATRLAGVFDITAVSWKCDKCRKEMPSIPYPPPAEWQRLCSDCKPFTRDYKETVNERAARDPEFKEALDREQCLYCGKFCCICREGF